MRGRDFLPVTTPAAGSARLAELKRQAQQRQQAERALAAQLTRDHLKSLAAVLASARSIEDGMISAPYLGSPFSAASMLRPCARCGLVLEVMGAEPPPDVRLLCAGCYLETAKSATASSSAREADENRLKLS